MIPIIRKSFVCFFSNNASLAHHSISCSLSLRLFCTSAAGDLVTSPVIFDLLHHKHQFSPQVSSKAASVLNRVKDPQKSDSILSILKDSGFSNSQLEKMVKYRPDILSSNLENIIKPKLKVFQDLGFPADDITKIISSNPTILRLNLNARILPSVSNLKGLLGTNAAVAKLWSRSGSYLIYDIERKIVPNIEFLESWGVPMDRVVKLLWCCPRFLTSNTATIRKYVEKAEKMGAIRSSKSFVYAVRAVYSLSDWNWELKLQAFRNWGFSDRDMMKMFVNVPQVFTGSVEKLKTAIDIILATGKYDLSSIVSNPTSLNYSIETRYKPRFQILEVLESKKLIDDWPSLAMVSQFTDERFFEKFVGPYINEIGEVYIATCSSRANI